MSNLPRSLNKVLVYAQRRRPFGVSRVAKKWEMERSKKIFGGQTRFIYQVGNLRSHANGL